VRLNLTKLIIDEGAAFLFGGDVAFELQEGQTTPEEEALAAIWDANRKMTFLNDLAITGGICGQVFVKTLPEGEGEAQNVRLVNVQPEYVEVRYEPQNIDNVWLYSISWEELAKDNKPLFRRQDIERDENGRWTVKNFVARKGNVWKPDPDNPDVVWAYDWPPIITCQNLLAPGSFYGYSDLEGLGLQDSINYVASKIQRILRYHMHPKTIGKNFAPGDVKIGVDDTMILPDADSDLWNLEMQSDLAGGQAFLDRLINWFMGIARHPRVDPAIINVGALSGFALRVLYTPLLQKTAVKKLTYGDMLVELNRRLLEMTGHGDDHIVTIHWPDPLPKDERMATEADKFELDYQVASLETVRTRRGLKHETEQERIQAQEIASGNVGALLIRNWERGQQTGFEEE